MKWTINKAAIEWGIDRRTLATRLAELGLDTDKGTTFHTREISRAVVGDLDAEKIKLTKADAALREIEVAEKRAQLVDLAEVQVMVRDALLPVSQRLRALPGEVAHRCNPTDPQFARAALQVWVDTSLPLIRSQLPQPAPEPRKPPVKRSQTKPIRP